jgi:hypothetical protein
VATSRALARGSGRTSLGDLLGDGPHRLG